MDDRRIDGPANYGCERRCLGGGQLAHRLAEIVFRGRLEAVVARAQIDLVAVHRENLFFRVMPLDLQGQDGFLNLAVQAAVRAVKKKSSGELHGEGAGALGYATAE